MPRPAARLAALAAVAAAVAVAPVPAHAAALRDCTSIGTWTFDQPLTTGDAFGSVRLDATTRCLRYTAGSGASIEEYSTVNWFTYSGNCQVMTLTLGSTTGVMVGERAIVYAKAGATSAPGTPGVHVVTEHPTCAGATVLSTYFQWANVVT
jgi:hypothetical protein